MSAPQESPYHYYEPAAGHGLPHDPFNAIIGPRPIGWISSVDAEGRPNLAPYSFFNGFNYRPPIIGFASLGWKDSVANIDATGEFVWNLTTRALVEQMNISCAPLPRGQSEADVARLELVPSRRVRALRVAASPVHFECRKTQIVRLQDAGGGELDSWLVLGEVVAVHIRRELLRDGIYRTAEAHPVLRAGGPGDYAAIKPSAMFELLRPQSAEDAERMGRAFD
ncbi:flavin reductase family protein [Burkholderia gladioli]|uniref:flavin reductase family protein n=1 Tax=Burkholderia gladioli TaxID=28095 RepID=UPI00163F7A6F|nr:flavin reductase family protein [Burkholderia gladioli]